MQTLHALVCTYLQLAIHLLNLSILSLENDAASPFQICAVVLPKLHGKLTLLTYIYTYTSNKNFILKYFRCRDGKRTETRIGMEGVCITHSCIPLYTVYMQHIMAHSGGMQEWVIQIPSIPVLVSVLFPSLYLKYFRIKFLLLVTSARRLCFCRIYLLFIYLFIYLSVCQQDCAKTYKRIWMKLCG